MYRSSSPTIWAGVSALIYLPGGPEMAPRPPALGRAPAKPWRASGSAHPEMAPRPPALGRAPAKPWRASGSASGVSQHLHADPIVRVHADRSGDPHRLGRDRLGVELRVGDERPGGGQRVRPARADADEPVVGLDHVAGARDDQ